MSLFPAYASGDLEDGDVSVVCVATKEGYEATLEPEPEPPSPDAEKQLLASDSDNEAPSPPPPPVISRHSDDFYENTKLENGYLRVSTLYYPGRPHYARCEMRGAGVDSTRKRRRYFERGVESEGEASAAAAAERAEEVRRALSERGRERDAELWQRLVEVEGWRGGAAAALAAADEARVALPRDIGLRAAAHRLARATLAPDAYLKRLQHEIAQEKCAEASCWLWRRVVSVTGGAGGGDAAAVVAVAGAACRALYNHPPAYPALLYLYGRFLQAAGLWEQLVLLVELLAAMCFPPAGFPPPPANTPDDPQLRLCNTEERLLNSGLPLHAVWCRVERARAAAHWRPLTGSVDSADSADPQRAPLPSDVADMLVPVVEPERLFHVLVYMLRLCKVPPLGGYTGADADGGEASADVGEALLPLLRCARRLPRAHPARRFLTPQAARALLWLAVDPPHYFTDEHGYWSWVQALWEASLQWAGSGAGGEKGRVALLSWYLRWLHALLLLCDMTDKEGRAEAVRIRGVARAVLRRHALDAALPYAQMARIELVAHGDHARAQRVALRALRAALKTGQATGAPKHHHLYLARVACEVGGAGSDSGGGAWGTACAVLGVPLPPDEELERTPPAELLNDALVLCEERCSVLENGAGGGAVEAMLPGVGEWAAARARLACPVRLRDLCERACAVEPMPDTVRYHEQHACALVAASVHGAVLATRLAHRYPHNAYLALMSAHAPLWACTRACTRAAAGVTSDTCALAGALPALLSAAKAAWAPPESALAVRALRRYMHEHAECGALLHALRIELEARAHGPARARAALYAALDAVPQHKWVYVRGAEWCAGESDTLADALLDRQLRVHTLRDELTPALPAPYASPTSPTPTRDSQ